MRFTSARAIPVAAMAGLVGAHAWPLVWSSRRARCALRPGLAGLGDPWNVALTFDDGPDPRSTPQFLRCLDDLGWTATFFFLGEMVLESPALAREVASAGHEIAVHGLRHRSHVLRRARDVRDDVHRSMAIIEAATDTTPRYFRPPYGACSTATLRAASEAGLTPVLWSSWGRDWRAAATAASVHRDVVRTLTPGATILLHDSDCTSAPYAWRAALGALPLLASTFERRSVTVGPLAWHGVVRHGRQVPPPGATLR